MGTWNLKRIGGGDVPVVVTDGEQRAALAVVRSLGRIGYPVHVVSFRVPSLAGVSKYAVSEVAVPDPRSESTRYVEAVVRRAANTGAKILLPITEASLLSLLPHRALLGAIRVPFPDAERVSRICDKVVVLETAASLGLDVPVQRVLKRPEDLTAEAAATLPFPIVLKPARSVAEVDGVKIQLGVSYAGDPGELMDKVHSLPDQGFPLLLQQRIVGPGIGIFLLLWEGRTLACFAHRRIREKPPSGGVSVYRESVAADPQLVAQSRRLLEALEWEGVAMVEYKVQEASGRAYLMEVNGRFWGSLQLAVDAGVDFPALLVAAALGDVPDTAPAYRAGVRSRWWWGDVDQLLLRWRRSPAELSLAPDAPSRWRALLEFLLLWRPGDRYEVFRGSDPRPFLHECREWVRRLLRHG